MAPPNDSQRKSSRPKQDIAKITIARIRGRLGAFFCTSRSPPGAGCRVAAAPGSAGGPSGGGGGGDLGVGAGDSGGGGGGGGVARPAPGGRSPAPRRPQPRGGGVLPPR